jgi:UPF0755 protein
MKLRFNKILKNLKTVKNTKAIAISLAVALVIIFPVYLLYAPVGGGDGDIEFFVKKGDGLNKIADGLSDKGLIRNKSLLVWYVKLRGYQNDLRAGKYVLSKNFNIPYIVSMMVEGRSVSNDALIKIPEGFNIWQIDRQLTDAGLIKEGQFSSRYYEDEGYLFPDTYRIHKPEDDSEEAINGFIEELRSKMETNFEEKTSGLLKDLTNDKKKEIIILASMLEKEVQTEKDMRLVAGLIYKRMSIGMKLQIDATVRYGACMRKFVANRYSKNCDVILQGPAIEIKIDSPYNSYTRAGFPVGPISSPGLKSIIAALNPLKSDYLYYLSASDGTTIFSKTSGEHVANRKQYLGL